MVYPYKRKAREEARVVPYKKPRITKMVRPMASGGRDAYVYGNRSTRGFLGLEQKFMDLGIPATVISTTLAGAELDPATVPYQVYCLNGITQGDGENDRDGRKVVTKSVMVKGTVDLPGADNINNGDTTVFIALVLDKQTNGAQLNAEDVFTTSAAGGLSSQPFRNLQYVQRFDVLASTTLCLENSGMAYNGSALIPVSTRKTFEFYRKLDLPVMYSGTGGSVSSIVDNSLHLIAVCDNAAAVPQIVYGSRVRFVG